MSVHVAADDDVVVEKGVERSAKIPGRIRRRWWYIDVGDLEFISGDGRFDEDTFSNAVVER